MHRFVFTFNWIVDKVSSSTLPFPVYFILVSLTGLFVLSCRSGFAVDGKKVAYAEMMTDDVLTSREERCFRLWINSLGIASYVNNVFEDVRNG